MLGSLILEETLYNHHLYLKDDSKTFVITPESPERTLYGITSTTTCGPEGLHDTSIALRREKGYQGGRGCKTRFNYIWSCEHKGPIVELEKEIGRQFKELIIVLDGEDHEYIEHVKDSDGEIIDTKYIVEIIQDLIKNKYPSIISTRIS